MQYKQITVNSILNKITSTDILFYGDYTIDPYQNCEFGCLYCDSSFEKTIFIKNNANIILKEELKKNQKGRIIIGSVHDPYQKAEKNYEITRKILKLIRDSDFSCHILTKSDLILRDIDILSEIKNCIVTISVISMDEDVSNIFEKKVIKPKKRMKLLEKLNKNNIKSGIAIMPVLPFITEENIKIIFSNAKKHNAKYIIHKFLELKGDQKICFINILKDKYPNLVIKYEELYKNSYMPNEKYIFELKKTIQDLCVEFKIQNKIDI